MDDLIHTDRHPKAQECACGFWVLYATSKNSILHHKLVKGWFGLHAIAHLPRPVCAGGQSQCIFVAVVHKLFLVTSFEMKDMRIEKVI